PARVAWDSTLVTTPWLAATTLLPPPRITMPGSGLCLSGAALALGAGVGRLGRAGSAPFAAGRGARVAPAASHPAPSAHSSTAKQACTKQLRREVVLAFPEGPARLRSAPMRDGSERAR